MNLSKIENLISVAESLGLPADEAREILTTRQFRKAVGADWRRSRKLDVTGVPTFVVGKQRVEGARPYEVLEQFVLDAGAVARA